VRSGLLPPPGAGLFMTTNPARSKCRTIRFATIAAMYISESCTRFLPLNCRAKAMEPAMSLGSARVSLSSGSGIRGQ
jgi:hypothetical protein